MDKKAEFMSIVKAAAERQYRLNVCKQLIKRAQEEVDYVARRKKLKLILGALVGGYVGARAGHHTKGVGGAAGAVLGAGTGALLGHASNKVRDWAGLDPMGKVVTVGKA